VTVPGMCCLPQRTKESIMTAIALPQPTESQPSGRDRIHLAVVIALTVWLLLVVLLGTAGAFVGPPGTPPLPIAIGVAAPLILFFPSLRLSQPFREFVLSLDLRLIAEMQAWRWAGLGFLSLYAHNVQHRTDGDATAAADPGIPRAVIPHAAHSCADAEPATYPRPSIETLEFGAPPLMERRGSRQFRSGSKSVASVSGLRLEPFRRRSVIGAHQTSRMAA
jgi:hypothetical protein